MTIETLNKANEIADTIHSMTKIYDVIADENCIRLKGASGITYITTDPALISVVKREISRRIFELNEELERI